MAEIIEFPREGDFLANVRKMRPDLPDKTIECVKTLYKKTLEKLNQRPSIKGYVQSKSIESDAFHEFDNKNSAYLLVLLKEILAQGVKICVLEHNLSMENE